MRVLGAAASVFLVGALVIAGGGLFGGPDTPFSVFGAPAGNGGDQQASHGRKDPAPGASSVPAAGSAKPSASADHSPSRRPGASPTPTNKAGKTPPGLGHSRKPR